MTRPSIDPNAEFLLTVLRELSALSGAVLVAGAAGDDHATRNAIDQMRQLRAELQGIGQDTKQQVDDAPAHTKTEVGKLLANIRQSDAFISAWCDRFNGIKTQEQLSRTVEGRNAIIDRLMPATWNWGADILTANDNVDAALIKTALERGQKRIVVFCLAPPHADKVLPGVRYLSDKTQAYAYFQNLVLGDPRCLARLNVAAPCEGEVEEASAGQYTEFHAEFSRAWKAHLVNKNTVRLFSNRWLMQGLANLPLIAEHAAFAGLQDRFVGFPLVIVSPGPSLDKNVHLLKQLKGKALLMAAGQTALALSRAGVIPDVIVVADPADILYLVDGFPMEKVEALLLGVACHPRFYETYKGKIITFNVNAGIDTWISDIFRDTVHIGSGGSVSTAIFTMGLFLKCDPIVLVGQDLALTDGRQYASNAADGNMVIKINGESSTFSYGNVSKGYENLFHEEGTDSNRYSGRTLTLPGYNGGMVVTKADYVMYHAEFEKHAEVENSKETPIRLYNCTEGGVFINGFENIPLRDVIGAIHRAGPPTIDISGEFQNIHAHIDVAGRRALLAKRLERAKGALEKCYELALRCAKLANQVQRSAAKQSALTKVESALAKAVRDSAFIALANQTEISNAIQLGVRAKTISQSLAASRILYTLVIREVPNIMPLVNTALEKLNYDHAH